MKHSQAQGLFQWYLTGRSVLVLPADLLAKQLSEIICFQLSLTLKTYRSFFAHAGRSAQTYSSQRQDDSKDGHVRQLQVHTNNEYTQILKKPYKIYKDFDIKPTSEEKQSTQGHVHKCAAEIDPHTK